MRRTLILGMIIAFLTGSAVAAQAASFSGTCKFAWNANTESDLAGYRAWVDKGGVQNPVVNVPVGTTPNVSCAALGITSTLPASADGSYNFNVVAYDNAGTANVSTVATIAATRDTVAPDTTITPTITGSNASFALASNETGVTFECQLDGSAFVQCTSPRTYTGLADGAHTFAARSKDAAGNTDASQASHAFALNVQAPAQPSGLSVTANFP